MTSVRDEKPASVGSQKRNLILSVAEKLFAQHGIESTSVRSITEEAGVNVASINYYFGSKDGLIEAVVERRTEALSSEAMTRLDALEKKREKPSLESVVGVFVDTMFELAASDKGAGIRFLRLMYRMMMEEPHMIPDAIPRKGPPKHILRFQGLISNALGRQRFDLEASFWDFHLMLSTTMHAVNLVSRGQTGIKMLPQLFNEKLLEAKNVRSTVVDYIASGIRGVYRSEEKNII